MERIVYRKTLDLHKNGVQFMLQGFETADKISRQIEITLMASGDAIDLPLEQITAVMYVTTPGATEPSINTCTIKDNTIIYDVLPITVGGITEMQLKLIETDIKGARSVIATPKFAVEVSESNTDEEQALQTVMFTALENAIARAQSVYDKRLKSIELDSDCTFRAIYEDGYVYTSYILKELFHKGEALLSQSYARGGTGVRTGEDTDNSMYYSQVSKSASVDAEKMRGETSELLTEARKHGVYTAFYIDFDKGEVEYISPSYKFKINKETGKLEAIGEAYKYEDAINHYVNEWFEDNDFNHASVKKNTEDIANLQNAVSDTGWQPLNYASPAFGKWHSDTGLDPQYRKIGNVVMIKGVMENNIDIYASEVLSLFNGLPKDACPSSSMYFLCQGSENCEWMLTITSWGEGQFSRYGTFEPRTIAPGVWLPFNITYIV